MRVLLLGATTLLSCAAFEPTPERPQKPRPDACSANPAYVAPPEGSREIAVNLSAALTDLMSIQRISLCVDGALFWQINADLDTKVQNTLRLTPGVHHFQLVAHTSGATSNTQGYRFEVHTQHELSDSNVTALDVDFFLSGGATLPLNERPKVTWTEEPITRDAGAADR